MAYIVITRFGEVKRFNFPYGDPGSTVVESVPTIHSFARVPDGVAACVLYVPMKRACIAKGDNDSFLRYALNHVPTDRIQRQDRMGLRTLQTLVLDVLVKPRGNHGVGGIRINFSL